MRRAKMCDVVRSPSNEPFVQVPAPLEVEVRGDRDRGDEGFEEIKGAVGSFREGEVGVEGEG